MGHGIGVKFITTEGALDGALFVFLMFCFAFLILVHLISTLVLLLSVS